MNKHRNSVFLVTSIFGVLSECACIKLYIMYYSGDMVVLSILNLFITVFHIYVCEKWMNEDYKKIFGHPLFKFLVFISSTFVTGDIYDAMKKVQVLPDNKPNHLTILFFVCLLPTLWMFNNLLLNPEN